jgi:hypothetical protein
LLIRPAKILFATNTHSIAHNTCINYPNNQAMKKFVVMGLALLMFASCATPKAYYETKEGKRKQKYYNEIQYGGNAHPKRKF